MLLPRTYALHESLDTNRGVVYFLGAGNGGGRGGGTPASAP